MLTTNPVATPDLRVFTFTAFVHPEPQGSAKAFVVNGRAIVTSANKKLHPFRSVVTREAISALEKTGVPMPLAGKHVPVAVHIDLYMDKPESAPKEAHPPRREARSGQASS
jgi:hypothetical protein